MSRLANAPLQEVIFEVHWDLERDVDTNLLRDKLLDMGQGAMQMLAKEQFPFVERRFPVGMPAEMMPHTALWQFRPVRDGWPVVQLGPGVLTVNETDAKYDWKANFYALIKQALDWHEEAYGGPMKYTSAELRYIDSVKVKDHGFSGWDGFVEQKLNLSVRNDFLPEADVVGLGVHQVYALDDGGQVTIAVNNGEKDGEEALVWQTTVRREGDFDKARLFSWADEAHALSKELFVKICKPDFHARFD